MFTDWPTRELPGTTKAYILAQWAFWLQQIIVINIEERRNDHWQMLAHHIVTIVLISTSYALHLTRVANLVLVLMDVVDIFFPVSLPSTLNSALAISTLTPREARQVFQVSRIFYPA